MKINIGSIYFLFLILLFSEVTFGVNSFVRYDKATRDALFVVQPEGDEFLVYANPLGLLQIPRKDILRPEFVEYCEFLNQGFLSKNLRKCEEGSSECFDMSESMKEFYADLRRPVFDPMIDKPKTLGFLQLKDLSNVKLDLNDEELKKIKSLYPMADSENTRFLRIKTFKINTEGQMVFPNLNSLSYLSSRFDLLPSNLVEVSVDGSSLRLNGFDLQCDYAFNRIRSVLSLVELQLEQDRNSFNDEEKIFYVYKNLNMEIKDIHSEGRDKIRSESRLIHKGLLLAKVLGEEMPGIDLSEEVLSKVVQLIFDEDGDPIIYDNMSDVLERWRKIKTAKTTNWRFVL